MKLDHIAIWVNNLEKIKEYYMTFFGAKVNDIYKNPATGFSSYFLSFGNGSRIEIMHRADIPDNAGDTIRQYKGYIHISFVVDTTTEVDNKARQLSDAGYIILRGPRVTGDGYYEFETVDPENNRLEVMTIYNG